MKEQPGYCWQMLRNAEEEADVAAQVFSIENDAEIPNVYTCDNDDCSPLLAWSDPPHLVF